MIYRKCILPELFDIGHLFYSMASGDFLYHEYENGELKDKEPEVKYQKWEQVDDRYDSLFGATYKVPVADYPENYDKIAITIYGDKWLCTTKTISDMRLLNRWESTYTHECNYTNKLSNTLIDELPRYFPNATINFIGNFSPYNTTNTTLDNVIDYLSGLATYPDYFIFNGVEGSFIGLNGDVSTITAKLDIINDFCIEHGIRALCIFTTLYDMFSYGPILNYLQIQNHYEEGIQTFALNNWIMKHTYIPEDYVEYGNNTNRSVQYKFPAVNNQGVNIEPLEWYVINAGGSMYREIIYNIIKKYILEQFLRDFNTERKCYYISLSHKDVTETTYGYYHGDKAKVYRPDLYPEQMITDIPIYSHPKYVFRCKYFQRNKPWNVFSNTGEFIAIALHTGFIENAWLCEQKGSTCEDEGSKIRQGVGVSQLANLMPVLREREGGETRINPPIMQGTGTSWLTISDEDKERYKNKLGFECPIEVYMSRDDYSFTITTRIHSEEGYQDLYQSIAAGKMTESLDTFPLYVAGGTTGLKNDVYSYIPVSGTRTEVHGNVYDLSMGNVALSNTTANHPTKFNACIFSNFKVFSELTGKWRSVFLHSQSATVVRDYLVCGTPVDHVTWLNEPTYSIGRTDANAFPVSTDLRYRVGNEWLNKQGFQYMTGKEPMNVEPWWYDSPLQSFRAFTRPSWYENDTFYCSGNISTMFTNWDWKLPCGEIAYPLAQISSDNFDKDKHNWRLLTVNNWQTDTTYEVGDVVLNDSTNYRCITDHTSGNFNDDISKWQVVLAWQANYRYNMNDVISIGIWRDVSVSAWQLDYDYQPNDLVTYDGKAYRCNQYHTSSDESFDEDKKKWEEIQGWEPNTCYGLDDYIFEDGLVRTCIVPHISGMGAFNEDRIRCFKFTGKRYLVIPCGWEERLYWYDGHYALTTSTHTKINNTWQNDTVIEEYEKNKLEFNRRRIKDKLFVALEDNHYPKIYHKFQVYDESEPDPRQRIVLFFQFWSIHYLALRGFREAVVHSQFDKGLQRTFYVNEGWNTDVNRIITNSDINFTDWRRDIYEGLVRYCNKAESFASNFYIMDSQTGKKRQVRYGDTLTLGNNLFFAGNFSNMWDEIRQWITNESLCDTSDMNTSNAVIHAAISSTNRPLFLTNAFDAFGITFPSSTSVIPVGFPIPSTYDNRQYVTLMCNFFYRWMMPVVLYTEVAGRYKLNDIMQSLDNLFLPYTQGTDGFRLVYKAKYFRQPK